MTKTKCFKKATTVLMAVIMTFAALSITAFAEGNITFYPSGSVGNMSVKIEYDDCNSAGIMSTLSMFTINSKTACPFKFTVSVPRATIKFYKNNEGAPCKTFTTPEYVLGMPTTLSTHIELEAGKYTVSICSTDSSKRVSGFFEIGNISSVGTI